MASETSRKQKAASPSDIVGACSPANLYLVQLLEDKKSISFEEPSEVRIRLVFQILDRLVPELGVYSELVKLIAEEIYAAVYSPRFTGSLAMCSQPADEVTRIPYFTLLTRIQNERNEEAEKAISELQHTRKILSEREEEMRQQKKDTEELLNECHSLHSITAALEENVRRKSEELRRLQKDRQTHEEILVKQICSYKASVQDLESLLQASQKQILALKPYKKVSDELQEAFQFPVEKKNVNTLSPIALKIPAKRTALIGSKQAEAISFLETTEHLYRQLLQVQNQVMDDFDMYVHSRIKSQLSGDEELDQHSLEKELKEKRAVFHRSMMEISTELSLLQQKKQSLKQQLTALKARAKKELQSRSHPPQVSKPGVVSGSSEGFLEESELKNAWEEEESISDFFFEAFHPDEMALNSYAAMLYISRDNGRIYEEITGAALCSSCGEKTLICPHKVGNERVILLPKDCTHLKVSRPQTHRTTLQAKLMKSSGDGPCLTQVPRTAPGPTETPMDSADHSSASQLPLRVWESPLQEVESSWQGEVQNTLDLCLSFTEQLLASLLREEENEWETKPGSSVQDMLGRLFHAHYRAENVSCLGLQDFLAAVQKYAPLNKVIALLGLVLCGTLDPSVLRYALLMADLLSSVSLLAVADLRVFASQVYPFLQGDDLENLALEFSAFSENQMSTQLLLEYILKLILQSSEPLFHECEDRLIPHSRTKPGYLSAGELLVAVEDLVPMASTHLCELLIQQSATSLGTDLLPITRAAQVASFLVERQLVRVQKEYLQQRFEKVKAAETQSQGTEQGAELKTLCRARLLTKYVTWRP
uniref:Uncharacterized protein LOC117359225 n=1 Tax=Geotrypetes seraphini TaxID=260995 RepID=A0A6P8QKW6_GEOSA|nr:uncharacterized protein LOC117359225 [Geotrypetes seraphini]